MRILYIVRGNMQIFYVDCDQITSDPRWNLSIISQLTTAEQTRVNSLRDPTHQARQAISFLTQYYALETYTGVQQRITRDPTGKPRCGDPSYHFNTSHSANHVVVCVDTSPCGIDIEWMGSGDNRRQNSYPQILYDTVGKSNQIPLCEFHPPEKAVRLWTQIEAWLKFVGSGLRGLDGVGVWVKPSDTDFSLTYHGFPVPPHKDISDMLPEHVYGSVFSEHGTSTDSIICLGLDDLIGTIHT
jgi:phosphopantetheinyl transferase